MLSDIFHTNSYTVLGTPTLTADNSAFTIMELSSRRVWQVGRGCLLLLGTWSHHRYIRGSVYAHLFLWLVITACVSTLITLWCLNHFIHMETLPLQRKGCKIAWNSGPVCPKICSTFFDMIFRVSYNKERLKIVIEPRSLLVHIFPQSEL
jgi:hypothetical protein